MRCRVLALAGVPLALAGCVHQTGLVICGRAGSPAVDEVAGGYCPSGDVQPPSFPLPGGVGWLTGGQQVASTERAQPVLLGQQAQRVLAERGLDLLPPSAGWPSRRARAGSSGDAAPGGAWIAVVVFAVVLLLLLIFILENRREVDIAYFGAHAHTPLGLALLLAAALGALLAAIPAAARIIQQRRAARRQPRAPAKNVNRTPTATPELPPKAAGQR